MQKIKVMNTYSIQFKNNISFEQYQMAIRVLEAIGLEVEKEIKLTEKQKESILRGIEQADKGLLKPHSEVMKKAREICGI
ncbi:hypothetical protein CAPN005_21710 [Capnocytophaga cynodegmi]|nr:hypothetical protein CAPN005_21710 [Capnocytophaga cynodegmi]